MKDLADENLKKEFQCRSQAKTYSMDGKSKKRLQVDWERLNLVIMMAWVTAYFGAALEFQFSSPMR